MLLPCQTEWRILIMIEIWLEHHKFRPPSVSTVVTKVRTNASSLSVRNSFSFLREAAVASAKPRGLENSGALALTILKQNVLYYATVRLSA